MMDLPHKILIIKDCTFLLPDDFEGNLEDAFAEFLKYREDHLVNKQYYDPHNLFSSYEILIHNDQGARVCGQYSMYKLVNGQYELVESSSPLPN